MRLIIETKPALTAITVARGLARWIGVAQTIGAGNLTQPIATRSRNEIGALSASTLPVSGEAGRMLAAFVPDIRRTAGPVGEMSAARRGQTVGIEPINGAIREPDRATPPNAGAADGMSATAEALSGQARLLNDKVVFFQVDGTDRPHEAARPAAPSGAGDVRALRARAQGFAGARPDPRAKGGGFSLDLNTETADAGFERMSA